MGNWQPIETAPKDGTLIDLWAYCENHNDWERRANCRWETMADFLGNEFDGWYGLNNGRWWSCNFVNPTHWMPIPDPPEDRHA